jgi:tRNA and rRNA cytosine-C5-methylases
MLGGEYDAFESCMNGEHLRGIRINPLKFNPADAAGLGFPVRKTPFCEEGYYLGADDVSIGHSPWHHAGAFYSQEPSAMSAVTILAPEPGEKVLDMCAAPGGKSTQIASALNGSGLLWSNEYVRKRAQILLSNIERMGIRNSVVSNVHPEVLAGGLEAFFDRVLVDAPCSGEGMFRRDPQAASDWSPEHSASCAVRQLAILDSASKCLRPGGVLVYSTCTFSFCENEDVIVSFLDSHPEFTLEPSGVSFGRPGFSRSDRYDTTLTRRIFPMDGGEGHFAAKMRKSGDPPDSNIPPADIHRGDWEKRGEELFASCFDRSPYGRTAKIGNSLYLLPEQMPDVKGLGVLRGGVMLGETVKNRIEPCHALFMAARAGECVSFLSLEPDSPRLAAFLRGEELAVDSSVKGYTAVACGNTVTGFGKCSGGRLKNRYPKGLRSAY